jgi:hypothetical protein
MNKKNTEDHTGISRKGGILWDQQTVTGGVRTYGTHVRSIEDAEHIGDGIYRFVIDIVYEEPQFVKGVLTCTVAEWSVKDPTKSFSVGCFMHNLAFEPQKAIVDILIKTENADIVFVNIEGRIVETRNLTL